MFLQRAVVSTIKNSSIISAAAASTCGGAKHTLPELGYDFAALEPIISREIMELHYTKHHQTYVNNLNNAETALQDAISKKDASKIISLGGALRFNGGGHINHSIFWKNLSPDKCQLSGDLKSAIEGRWGSFDAFKKDMVGQTVAVQGSGWGWLGYNKQSKSLQIVTLPNQDPLEAVTGLVPILGIDVWEHAYYLQYKNLRPNYVEAIFDVINWKDLGERFSAAAGKKC